MLRANESLPDVDAHLSAADPALGRVIAAVIARTGRQRVTRSRVTSFQALVRAIVYQSVSGKSAAVIFARLRKTLGGNFSVADILGASPRLLARIGLSRSKSEAVHNLAAWFVANRGTARDLPKLPDHEVMEALTAIPGIGAWTVNVFLIFHLGRLDVMPAHDFGIRRGVALAYGLEGIATPRQVQEKAMRWRPYRSIASMYLWQAVKLKIEGLKTRR